MREIVERFGLQWPIEPGVYSPGTFTEVMLWRHEDREKPIAVFLYGVQVGWVPEIDRESIIRRMPHVRKGTMVVVAPAQLWVSSRGVWGLTVQA